MIFDLGYAEVCFFWGKVIGVLFVLFNLGGAEV
jgi:hypothetical protein